MGKPAAVLGDKILGPCKPGIHQIIGASGAPQPSPAPLPFSAPLAQALAPTVRIAGKPAAVVGSAGVNTPPHVGLHATDPFMVPLMQRGTVVAGSTTVRIEQKPAAMTGAKCTICAANPGQLVGTATTVLIGG